MKTKNKYWEETMKVYIHFEGDRSVGMFPFTMTLDTDMTRDNFDTREDRNSFRESLVSLAEWVDYGKSYIAFEDECENCGERLERYAKGWRHKNGKLCQMEKDIRR